MTKPSGIKAGKERLRIFGYAVLCLVVLFFPVPKILSSAKKHRYSQPSSGAAFYNGRLKTAWILNLNRDYPIDTTYGYLTVSGMLLPESKDKGKALAFPEVLRISCTRSQMVCRLLEVDLGLASGMVIIYPPDETDYRVESWGVSGLLASYGPARFSGNKSEKCHRSVLTMTFQSGAVTLTDVPTRGKGCEIFTEANSYWLAQGEYYVDTTPKNTGSTVIPAQ